MDNIMMSKITMLARYYGVKTQSNSRLTEGRIEAVKRALEDADNDVISVKKHIDDYVDSTDDSSRNFRVCFDTYSNPKQNNTKSTESNDVTDAKVQYSMGILEQAVIQLISKTQAERIESEIMGNVENEIRSFIQREYGSIERKITTIIDNKKVEVEGVQHEKFDTVLKFVANNEPVFLTGPAGSGKNVLCKQVAQALELKFYFTNAVTQEYKLTGFVDANGRYQETQFYKAFTQGGLFMLDEMDASIPEVLVILNAAIANRYFDFPGVGYTEAHPDFRVVAAGNTTGNGADYQYVGRNQLDAASLDRFAVIEIDYSPAIEMSVAENDTELLEFCREFRRKASECGCQIIVSYRGIGRLKKMLNLLDIEEAIRTCLTKGLEKDSIRMIADTMTSNKYSSALKKIAAA